MKVRDYILIILFHLFLGAFFYYFKFLSIGYAALIIPIGCYFIIKNRNKANEAMYWAAYIVGVEVFLRMTKGNIGNEFGKYGVIIFMLLGMYFSGISKKATPYFFYLFFLIPGLVYGMVSLDYETDIRKAVVFNLLGPICLAISSIYLVDKKIDFEAIEKLTRWMLYPLFAMLVYIILFSPTIKEVVTGTDSNSATSGGFGPNQVSIVLGLGMFLVFVRLLFFSKTFFLILFHSVLLLTFSYRGLITFSRGGFIAGVLMIILLLFFIYFYASIKAKFKIGIVIILLFFGAIGVFTYSVSQTGGMIVNRYKGEDALGREKASKFSGREELATMELQMFFDNPILGVGVGKNKENKEEITGEASASHNEITRMLAEHGFFGILSLFILLFYPLFHYFFNKKYIFLFSFYFFWLLTINHAAMRIAAPAFIYALTLLNFSFDEQSNSISRQPTL